MTTEILKQIRDALGGAGGQTRAVLLDAATAPTTGPAAAGSGKAPTFALSVVGAGAVSAAVTIRARHGASDVWVPYGTMAASGTNTAVDSLDGPPFAQYQAQLTAVSGTGAAVTLTKGD